MLKLKEVTFENPDTGKKIKVDLPHKWQISLKSPQNSVDDDISAYLYALMIALGENETIDKFLY